VLSTTRTFITTRTGRSWLGTTAKLLARSVGGVNPTPSTLSDAPRSRERVWARIDPYELIGVYTAMDGTQARSKPGEVNRSALEYRHDDGQRGCHGRSGGMGTLQGSEATATINKTSGGGLMKDAHSLVGSAAPKAAPRTP
jgi:hypothetical protein